MWPRLELYCYRKKGQRLFFEPKAKLPGQASTLAAQQLALNLLQATCGNVAALIHDYLGIEGRVLVQNIRDNVRAVLKPTEVVFLQLETALHGVGCSLKAQCYWDSVGRSFSAEETNTVMLCPHCRLGSDPGACNPLSHPRAPSSENTSWQRPAVPDRPSSRGAWELRVHACFLALFHLAAQQPKGSAPSLSFRKRAVEQGTGPQSSSTKVLGDALLPQVSSETEPKFTLELHRPNQWLSHLPGSTLYSCRAAWNRDELQGSLGTETNSASNHLSAGFPQV